MTNSPKYDAFISYSRPDSESAEKVVTYLRDVGGLQVLVDTWSLVPGTDGDALSREGASEHVVNSPFLSGPQDLGNGDRRSLTPSCADRRRRARRGSFPRYSPERGPSSAGVLGPPVLDRPTRNIDDDRVLSRLIAGIESAEAGGEIAQEQQMGDSLRAAGDLVEATSHYGRALSIARAAHGSAHPMSPIYAFDLRASDGTEGNYASALATLQEALEIGV